MDSNDDIRKELQRLENKLNEAKMLQKRHWSKIKAYTRKWIWDNFQATFHFGNSLEEIGFTKKEKAIVITKILDKCDFSRLDYDTVILLRIAFCSLFHNAKEEYEYLKNKEHVEAFDPLAEIVLEEEVDQIVQLAIEGLLCNTEGLTPKEAGKAIEKTIPKELFIQRKITIPPGTKKKPRLPKELNEKEAKDFMGAAKILQENFNIANRKNKGIPNFLCRLAYQIDFWLKNVIPEITTYSIIRKFFEELGEFVLITDVNKYIERGKALYQK